MFPMFWVAKPYQSVADSIICCSKAIALTLPPPTSVPAREARARRGGAEPAADRAIGGGAAGYGR